MVKPCDNCKRANVCELFKYVNKNLGKLHPWKLGEKLHEMSAHAVISKMNSAGTEIEFECYRLEPIKKETDYSGLVDISPTKNECDCNGKRCSKNR